MEHLKYVFLILLCYSFNIVSESCIFPWRLPRNDVGRPLFLTPYIESGHIHIGQSLAYVKPLAGKVKSYSGYLTVNKTCNSNLFFWYFPAENDPSSAPVVLWLQGGPGSPSLYGLFEENGAFYFQKNGTVSKRDIYWSQVVNIIYIDSPVGTGYSFTGLDECYAKDEVRVGKDLLIALLQFFQLFPHLKENDFFVSGESYGGKYVPAVAYTIHEHNEEHISEINLKGIIIGNGLSDLSTMVNYGDYFYQLGLIDSNQREVFLQTQNEILQNIQEKKFNKASELFQTLILGGNIKVPTYFYNVTGYTLFYNYLHDHDYSTNGNLNECVQKTFIRRSIHVGPLVFHEDWKVYEYLFDDISKSAKPWVEVLLENYRVLYYSGQLDLIVPYPMTENFLRSLNWSGADIYNNAPRNQWTVGKELAGYWKTAKNLTEVLVRNAGHMVPTDQPLWAFDLITRFIFNKPF